MQSSDISGYKTFTLIYHLFSTIRSKGLLATMTFYLSSASLVALVYAWKARQVVHWRLSSRIPAKDFEVRQAACTECKSLVEVLDRRFKDRMSQYCGSCGCKNWRWSELATKNSREGHYCPLGKHPGSEIPEAAKAPGGGCKGCGEKKDNGKPGTNGVNVKRRPARHRVRPPSMRARV